MGQYHRFVSLTSREFLSPSAFGDGSKLSEFSNSTTGAMFALGQMLLHEWKNHKVVIVGDCFEPTDIPEEALTGFSLGDASLYEATHGQEWWDFTFEDYEKYDDPMPDMKEYLLSLTFNDAAEVAYKHCLETRLVKEGVSYIYDHVLNAIYKNLGKGKEHHLIVNLSKKEFLNPKDFDDYLDANDFTAISKKYGVMSALVALLAVSCKGGARKGGDIDSTSELIGSWGGDSIAIIPSTEVSNDFSNISGKTKDLFADILKLKS